jgi:acyl-CoA thioesterase-1
MRIPPNYGAGYSDKFYRMFEEIAAEEKTALLPFLLDGVGGEASLNLPDGIHPNEKGYKIVAQNVLTHLEPLVKERAK